MPRLEHADNNCAEDDNGEFRTGTPGLWSPRVVRPELRREYLHQRHVNEGPRAEALQLRPPWMRVRPLVFVSRTAAGARTHRD
jgi:hypothetical protein